jgi:hypothetical protein
MASKPKAISIVVEFEDGSSLVSPDAETAAEAWGYLMACQTISALRNGYGYQGRTLVTLNASAPPPSGAEERANEL